MTTRRFPRSPEITPRPFDGGPNPFADDVTAPVSHNENPLAAPAANEVQPYKPTDYVPTLPERSSRILTFGIIGASFMAISVLVLAVVFFSTPLWSPELVYCLPANLLGLAFTIPAWIFGSTDLRAMQAGAMDKASRTRTRIGYHCGWIGTLVGLAPFVSALIAIFAAIVA